MCIRSGQGQIFKVCVIQVVYDNSGSNFNLINEYQSCRFHDNYEKHLKGDNKILPYPTFMKYMRPNFVEVIMTLKWSNMMQDW